jgi:hypothetical protein
MSIFGGTHASITLYDLKSITLHAVCIEENNSDTNVP